MKNKLLVLSVLFLGLSTYVKAQDTILKRNKEKVIAKIIEISQTEIKYKRADLPDGPTYTESRSVISSIHYSNGSVDDFMAKKPTPPPVPVATVPTDMTPRYVLVLNDATQLKGTVIKESKGEVVFLDDNLGEKTISRKKVASLKREYGDETWVFTLTDGSVITGKIIRKTETETAIETQNLGNISIPTAKVRTMVEFDNGTISKEGSFWFKNPNATRYLFAPSAFGLRKGEGYYQNFYGAGNAFNYGLTDYFSIGGGVLGPLGIFITPKVSTKVNKYVHVAGGLLIGNGFFPINGNNFALGEGYCIFTVGNYDHNITAGAGYGFVGSRGETKWQKQPMIVANGMTRVSRKIALVTENWFVPVLGDPFNRGFKEESHYEAFFSYACRIMSERTSVDIGFVNTPWLIDKGYYVGIPYIDFVIRFGKYKEDK
jgi:hypothetical protein